MATFRDNQALCGTMSNSIAIATPANSPKPLQVYLDSNDYSVLADPMKRTVEIQAVDDELSQLVASGKIQIRLSAILVLEAAPTAENHAAHGERRATCIARLCQNHVLLSPDKLFAIEAGALLRNEGVSPWESQSPCLDDGDWLPDLGDLESEFLSIEDVMRDALKQGPVGHRFRRKPSLFLRANGAPTLLAQKHINQMLPKLLREMQQKYPAAPEAVAAFRRYFQGTGGKAECVQGIKQSIANPECLMKWFSTDYARMSPLHALIRDGGVTYKASLQKVCEEQKPLVEHQLSLAASRKNAASTLKDILLSAKSRVVPHFVNSYAGQLGLSPTDTIDEATIHSLAPSVYVLAAVLEELFTASLLSETPRNSKPSDYGDCLHAVYAPYVDIFRADNYMAPVLKRVMEPFGTRIVDRLEKLPQAIGEELSRR